MLEIDCQTLVPIVWGHFACRMALIMRCIVDQNMRGTMRLPDLGKARFERMCIGEIEQDKINVITVLAQPLCEIGTGLPVTVEKNDARFLSGKVLDNGFANARSPARDQDKFIFKIGLNRSHDFVP